MKQDKSILADTSELRERFEQVAANFLNVDMDLCLTFAERAWAVRDAETRQRNTHHALTGYKTIAYFLAKGMLAPDDDSALRRRLLELKPLLADLAAASKDLSLAD